MNPFSLQGGGGGGKGGKGDEIEQLRNKIEQLQLPEEAKKIVEGELNKVSRMSAHNSEYHVIINYLQTIADLPWNTYE